MNRLGVRISIAFILVALVGTLILTRLFVGSMDDFSDDLVSAETERIVGDAREEIASTVSSMEERLDALGGMREFREILRPVAGGPLAGAVDIMGLQTLVEEILPGTGLDLLEVISPDGTVLARGHFPESFGDREDPDLIERVLSEGGVTLIRNETVSPVPGAGDRVVLERFVPLDDSSGILVGGVLLESIAERAAAGSGAEIVLVSGENEVLSRGAREAMADPEYIESESGIDRPLMGARVYVPIGPVLRLKEALIDSVLLSIGGGIGVAVIIGIFLSLGMTRHLARLEKTVRAVGEGDLEARPKVEGTDEIASLAAAFSEMMDELDEKRNSLIEAERRNAWRNAARRTAHEIRNALSPLTLGIGNLRRSLEASGGGIEMIEDLEEETERLKRIAGAFSELGRLPDANPSPYDMEKGIRESARLFGAGLEITITGSIPGPVIGDEALLPSVWGNIIKNAREAMGGEGNLDISLGHEGPFASAGFTDHGPGLDEETLARIFEPFFTTKREGSGIGLGIVRMVVEALGGDVSAGPAEGGGLEVRVRLLLEEER